MNTKKIMISALTVLSVTTMGVAVTTNKTTTAFAKAKAAKVVKTTTYKAKHKVHVQGGWMYANAKLTHKKYHLTKHLYTKFYASKKVTVRKTNGKKVTLKYLTSKNSKVKGYVYANNVRNQWGYGKYSVAAYRKRAVRDINHDRATRGLKPLTETKKLDQIAQRNSNRMLKDGRSFKVNVEGTPHAGWIVDDYLAPKSNPIVHYENGTQWGQGSVNSWMRRSDLNRDIGAIPYLMSAKHTRIGLGGTQHGQAIYMFVLLSND
ncbi:CAP domain-containing protein [Lactiplantibacillus dongliensis]|uniref:CAP domain-containing protein n=1 Tax=Lactiplantibacillus dongliensis TaxID=2559919 RepID=A0ABW1R6Y4_9LACO|nr:CAP domain-containing protein [Lactiplantibacillus dongliensis]